MRSATLFVAAIGLLSIGLSSSGADAPQNSAPMGKSVTLLGTLAEWNYPGAKMPRGATMSDGGNPTLQSVKLQAVLTTADPFEKVIAFYEKKLEDSAAPEAQANSGSEPGAYARSVTQQDDSQGRGVAVRIFVVNKAATSTTLVISRAEEEKETHIAWLHYERFESRQ